MTRRPDTKIDRRRFFRAAARGAVLAVMAGAAVVLGRRQPNPQTQSCDRQSVCRNCPILQGCGMPQAHVFRDAVQGDRS